MFPLIITVWAILLSVLGFCALDYQSDDSFIRKVFSASECRVAVVLWMVVLAVCLAPFVVFFIHDFKAGGDAWQGALVILSLPFLAVALGLSIRWLTMPNTGH